MHQNGSLVPCELLPQWFWYGHNCKLTKKGKPDNFLPYLISQAEICSSVFV